MSPVGHADLIAPGEAATLTFLLNCDPIHFKADTLAGKVAVESCAGSTTATVISRGSSAATKEPLGDLQRSGRTSFLCFSMTRFSDWMLLLI